MALLFLGAPAVIGVLPSSKQLLPNFDERTNVSALFAPISVDRVNAAARLELAVPGVWIDKDELLESPAWIASRVGFLTGPGGAGKSISANSFIGLAASDSNRVVKAFLEEHRDLFGHGADVLASAIVKRDFVSAHNGMRTVVWEQQVDGIPVFQGLLIAHTTRSNELVSISSHFVADPATAATSGTPNRAALQAAPAIAAEEALRLAAANLGEDSRNAVTLVASPAYGDARKHHQFTSSSLKGDADTELVWLPMNGSSMRLCWEVILMSRTRGEMYRVLIDAQTGRALVRHCLTANITNATYRVYTSDSPSPFSPGLLTPATNQPPVVPRVLVTTNAFNTNASPNGWINDGVNETIGNNVDAHTDHEDDDLPDLPRPHGSPFRVFDFPLDLSQDPLTYSNAAVVQLFYYCNWYHDKLYELGFTEAAGNFQSNNFGRGGLGNDAVAADSQDGGGTDNANFSTPPDGSPGRMQMYLFSGPSPRRDGSLDAEIVFHEHTHGLSGRLVGGGVGITQLQTGGMGEGWSDFYALCLLSESGDDPHANYAMGGYATLNFSGLTQNYYFGIRRYPYSTDLTKNPLTFKDIDPSQASAHSGIPKSPVVGGGGADEVHNQGEVWCSMLWEVRANLVDSYGFAGNQLVLQLVTDGMKLSPANPNFVQARDAILQADMVDTGGANQTELWKAFAKRGLGATATSPASSTATGVHEAFDLPFVVLGMTMPGTATEGAGTLVGQGSVFLPSAPSTNVVVTISSSNIAEVTVTSNVTILAGQTNAFFDLTIVDDTRLDGTQITRINVSAPGYGNTHSNITIFDNESAILAVSAPATATEGDAPVATSVNVSSAVDSNVQVALLSSNTNVIRVPASVTVAAGQTTAVFNVTIVDDAVINGDHSASITAHVVNWTDGVANLTVHDNESTNLTVLLPASVMENAGALSNAGTVKIAGTLSTNLTVTLNSDDTTELLVPTNVTILAGQLSANFNLTPVDDGIPDGPQIVHVTASAAGFTSGATNITIIDFESPPAPTSPFPAHLATNVDPNADLAWNRLIVNGGFETGDFSGWTKENTGGFGDFVINDGSYFPASGDGLTAPFAGSFSALVDQSGGGTHAIYQDVVIPFNAADAVLTWADKIRNFGSSYTSTQGFRVEARDTNNVPLGTIFSTQPGDPFLNNWVVRNAAISNFAGQTVRIAFFESDDQFYLNVHLDSVSIQMTQAPVTNDVYFGTNPIPGPAQFLGSTTNSTWTLPPLAPATTYYWQIVSRRVGSAPGPIWQFTTRGVDHFAWNPAPSTQYVNVPFSATVTTKDVSNITVSNFSGPISIGAALQGNVPFPIMITEVDPNTPDLIEFMNVSANAVDISGWRLTLYDTDSYPGPLINFVVPNGTIAPAGGIFRLTEFGSVPGTYPSFNTGANINWLPSAAVPIAVLVRDAGGSIQDFVCIGAAAAGSIINPVPIPTNHWSGSSVAATTSTSFTYQRTGNSDHNNSSDWGLAAPSAGQTNAGLVLPFPGSPIALSISPTNSGVFSNGVWTGALTVLQAGTNVMLKADDGIGHTGSSAPFQVVLANDPAVSMLAAPSPVFVGSNVTFSLAVTNKGAVSATGTKVTNTFSGGATFVSASTTQGTFTNTGSTVVFTLGAMASNASANLSVVVKAPLSPGSITNTANVAAVETDTNLANNITASIVSVIPKPVLLFSSGSNSLTLNWTGGYILQTATNVLGPYVDILGPTNSYATNFNTGPQRYFRLRN